MLTSSKPPFWMRAAKIGWILLGLVAALSIGLTLTSIRARADAGGFPTPTFTPLPTWTSIPTEPVFLPDETTYPIPQEKGFAFIETPTPTMVFLPSASTRATGGVPLLCWPLALGVVLIIALGTLIILQDRGVMPYG